MARLETWLKQDLKRPLKVQYLGGNLFSQDNQANLIGVEVFDEGIAATLGGSVSASVIRADGGTVAVTSGTVSGNKATVVLPQAAYAVPGQVSIVLKLTQSGVVTTLAALVAIVYKSSTDTVIDPGTILPSVETLIAQINTAVASIPADYSSLWTSLAPAFSDSTAYAAGQYFTYNGHLYRFTADHAAGSFVTSDCVQVDIGSELTSTKSAITPYNAVNLLAFITKTNSSLSNVSYTWNGDTCTAVSGTGGTSGQSVNEIYKNDNALPFGLEIGKRYFVKYNPTGDQLRFHVRFRNGSTTVQDFYFTGDGEFTVPSGITGVIIRLTTYSTTGVTINETVTPLILNTIPNQEFESPYIYNKAKPVVNNDDFDFDDNISTGTVYFSNVRTAKTISNGPLDITNYAFTLTNFSFELSSVRMVLQQAYIQAPSAYSGKTYQRLINTSTKEVLKDWISVDAEFWNDPYTYKKATVVKDEGTYDFDDNVSTGTIYLNNLGSSTKVFAHAPIDEEKMAVVLTNDSMDISGTRYVLQSAYIQAPKQYKGQTYHRIINTSNKSVAQDWLSPVFSNYGNKISIFGDSITAGYPQLDNDDYKWWSYLRKYFDISNYAKAGAGLLHIESNKNGKIFADGFNDTSCDYLCVFMGTNDYGDKDLVLGSTSDSKDANTVCGALRYVIETVMAKCPNLCIIGILPLNRSDRSASYSPWDKGTVETNWGYGTASPSGTGGTGGYTLNQLCDALKTIYEDYGIPVIDNRQSIIQRLNINSLLGDGLHPNLLGYQKLSQHLCGEIMRIAHPI